jgi:hypothetical protein
MPDLTDFQLEVTRLFFSLPASRGFLLAGGAALLAQHLTTRPTEDLDFFTAPNRGHVPAARDALEAAARKRGWATERIHDSDTFCRLVIRSDAAEVVTDLAVDTPPDFPASPPPPGPRWLRRNSPGASCSRYSTGPRHGTSPTYDYSPGASARMFCWPAPHRSTRALISGPWPA